MCADSDVEKSKSDAETDVKSGESEPQNELPDRISDRSTGGKESLATDTNQTGDDNELCESHSEDTSDDSMTYESSPHAPQADKMSILKAVLAVPGTKWMITFVLIYKLGKKTYFAKCS